jgi:uncharacterized glyoxalase superfamily protein PhnB
MDNRSKPPGIIIPELAYADVGAAADWLCRAFGFAERLRIADHRIQLTFGPASVVVIEGGDVPDGSPRTHGTLVSIDDVDAHYARAAENGARILRPPETHFFGERQYTALDLGGHQWTFTQSVADVDPASWGGVVPG